MFYYWRDNIKLSQKAFYSFWIVSQITSFFIIGVGSAELQDPHLVEIGFVDNFINSILFIVMFYNRDGLRGQSIYIALSKAIGTGAISLSWYIFAWPFTTPLTMIFLTIGIAIFDIIYIILVYQRAKEMKIDVWRRW